MKHALLLGATDLGKSYFLLLMMCRWLYFRRVCPARCPGFLFIDPHSTNLDRMLAWMVYFGVSSDDVILIELDNEACLPAIQPLSRHGATVTYQTGALKRALIKAGNKSDFDGTPLLDRSLTTIVAPLVEANLSPAELEAMLSLDKDEPLRLAILERCTSKSVRTFWHDEFLKYNTVAQKFDAFGSGQRRLEPFHEEPFLRRLFGQTNSAKVINWREVMDSGKIVLCRLSGGTLVHESEVNVCGAFILNEIVRAAMLPPARTNNRAFYVVVDELHKCLTPDHLTLVRETRKFRTYFVAATQEPAALRAYDEELFLSVMTNCRAKVIFGGVTTAELEPLVRDAIAPIADPDMVKFDVERTFYKPRETTRLVPREVINIAPCA